MPLGADTINIGECLKSWIRSGITEGLPVDVEGVLAGSVSGEEGNTSSSNVTM
jgi:hypothetical protein